MEQLRGDREGSEAGWRGADRWISGKLGEARPINLKRTISQNDNYCAIEKINWVCVSSDFCLPEAEVAADYP